MPIVADNIDTLILNVKLRQDFPLELAQQLDVLKEASQDAEEDLVTDFTFAGERLFIKPHGAGKQWRWILHSPSLHLDVGLGQAYPDRRQGPTVCGVSVGHRDRRCAHPGLCLPHWHARAVSPSCR